MSIGSKPADKLEQNHWHNLHMPDNSKVILGKVQPLEGELPRASMHMEMVGSCYHKPLVRGMLPLVQDIACVRET